MHLKRSNSGKEPRLCSRLLQASANIVNVCHSDFPSCRVPEFLLQAALQLLDHAMFGESCSVERLEVLYRYLQLIHDLWL